MTTRRATLSSVALAAGVSRQTVSNVLNAPDRVQPETAARVRAAIEAQRYVPSVAARQLRTGRSGSFGYRLSPPRSFGTTRPSKTHFSRSSGRRSRTRRFVSSRRATTEATLRNISRDWRKSVRASI